MKQFRVPILTIALLFAALSAAAQTTVSTLTGTVTSGGTPLPGVTVTVTSPALQGARVAVSGENGAYSIPALPPGAYTVTFELEGLAKVTKTLDLRLQETSRADADLQMARAEDLIVVTATAPSVLETSQVSTNLSSEQIENLPVGRTILGRLNIAPGVSTGGPGGQIIIGGAPSSQNLYLVNGVVVNENLRGQPHTLFIEDAIQETTILQSGASAEYGRFTGGVVSTLTKSGGNEFSGTLRDNLTNDNWTDKTRFASPTTGVGEADHADTINPIFEATLGGRIIRDRLWFFTAGRYAQTTVSTQTGQTNIPFDQLTENRRLEVKLTDQLTPKHTLVGSYLDVENVEGNNFFTSRQIVDLRSVSDRETPNSLQALHYSGIISNNFLVEGQYSQKKFAFVGGGAAGSDRIEDTVVIDIANTWRGWSPTFGAAEAKRRDNEDLLLKATYFLTSKSLGTHTLIGGFDEFHDTRREDNLQSGSGFRFFGDMYVTGDRWYLRTSPSSQIQYNPLRIASKGADFETRSLFINDKWDLNRHLSFNVGARYDRNNGVDEEHNEVTNDSRISPRLGAIYDVAGDGRLRFSANYGRFVAVVDSGIGNSVSGAGSTDFYLWDYRGPAINPIGTPDDQLLPTDEVLRRVFEWFDSIGGVTHDGEFLNDVEIGGLTAGIDGTLRSPYMDELSLGVGTRLGANGYFRVDAIRRQWGDFFTLYRNLSTQRITDGKRIDFALYGNEDSGDLEREYNALQFQGSYRFAQRFEVGGNYTFASLKGNVEGEDSASGSIAYGRNDRPEYVRFDHNNPTGYLNGDMRHRANLWVQYQPAVPFGSLNVSLLERFHSGMPYSAAGLIDVREGVATGLATGAGVANPGYELEPASVTYYFSKRGAYRLDDITATDLNLNYSFPVAALNFFVKADVLNVFNQQGVEDPRFINTTVRTRRNGASFPTGVVFGEANVAGGRAAAFNPYTTAPVEYVYGVSDPNGTYHWAKDVNFGKPTSPNAYQQARTFRFAVGLRF
jgi:hypothetical protein